MTTKIVIAAVLLAAAAFAASPPGPARVDVAFRLVAADPAPGWEALASPTDGRTWYAAPEVLLDQAAFASASAMPGEGETWVVDITMTPAGRERLAAITTAHKGERLGMVVDGVLVSAPVIRAAITEGRALLTGRFSADEARRIAAGVMAER